MKPLVKLYLKTLSFIFISFLIIALIMALLQNFSILSSSISSIILMILGYIIIIVAAIYFSMRLNSKALWHLLAFGAIYYLLSLILNISSLQLFIQLIKPIVFIVTGILSQFIFNKK